MGEPITGAGALRALIGRVEAGEAIRLGDRLPGKDFYPIVWHDASTGSLDAVARLETPLRERGWWTHTVNNTLQGWTAILILRDVGARRWHSAKGEAPTEPRARLLAVLNALLWECEHAP